MHEKVNKSVKFRLWSMLSALLFLASQVGLHLLDVHPEGAGLVANTLSGLIPVVLYILAKRHEFKETR